MRFEKLSKAALAVAMGGLMAFAGACDDLQVENPNEPGRERALATPGDVSSLIGGAYLNYFQAVQGWGGGASTAMGVTADQQSSSWGNVGMKDFGNEPRLPINNNPSWSYNFVVENGWYNSYGAIVAASDGLRAMESSEEVGNALGARERAFAKTMQGFATGWVALQYDQGFVVDETTDLSADQQLQPYAAVMDAALAKLQEASDIASSNSFTLPESWVNGHDLTSDQLNRYIHSQMARYIASLPRNPSEAQSADWDAVISHVDQGIQSDFSVTGEATGPWWSGLKTYGGDYDGFVRSDYRDIGPADQSGQYQTWEATTAEQRQPFDITTPDRRITGAGGPQTDGLYKNYAGPSPFPEARGTYYYSNYGDKRYHSYAVDFVGEMEEVNMEEMALLKAEAYLMNGQPGDALPLINDTRVANGQLPPAELDGAQGDANCVPKNMDGTCGDLMEVLQHEKRMETYALSGGIPYFDDRRWGDLLTGTAIHFPVPGIELQVLQQEIYTFGGAGNDGAAPSAVPMPGEDDIMKRIAYDLETLKKWRQTLERPAGMVRK